MRPRAFRTLQTIKRDYLAGLGTLAELASRYHVPFRTASRYCAREGWREQRETLGLSVAQVASEVATETAIAHVCDSPASGSE